MPRTRRTPAPWPNTGEDRLLHTHWQAGPPTTLYYEVEVGGRRSLWPDSGKRRFDGVLVHGGTAHELRGGGGFWRDVEGAREPLRVDLVEAKSGLSESVIGQALAGRWMFERQFPTVRVEQNIVLYRHEDPAMRHVADALGVTPVRGEVPDPNNLMKVRPKYRLLDADIARITAYRERTGGLIMTRVPIAGEHSGVEAWRGSAQTYVKLVRFAGSQPSGIILCESSDHFAKLAAQYSVEVVVTGSRLDRPTIGVAKAHAFMLREQYRIADPGLAVVVERDDAALHAACDGLGVTVHTIIESEPAQPGRRDTR